MFHSAYLHIPFCRSLCPYCDFFVVVERGGQRAGLLARLLDEIRTEPAEGGPLRTVHLGGGTPSQLAAAEVGRLLEALRSRFGMARDAEIALEANPDGLQRAYLEALRELGVSRISLGVQSFDDEALHRLGRRHRGREARRAVELVREAGFATWGVDLIHGVPGQDLERSLASVRAAVELGAPHVSHYGLTWHEGTALWRRREAGKLHAMDEELEADIYEGAAELLESAGLEHYEISNFARPGHRSAHNVACWQGETYVAFGPSAVGFVNGARYRNPASLQAYLRGEAREVEPVEGRTAEVESVIAGLRLVRDGLDRAAFARRHGRDLAEAFPRALERGRELGLLELTAERLRLRDRRALLLYDSVIGLFLEEPRRPCGR